MGACRRELFCKQDRGDRMKLVKLFALFLIFCSVIFTAEGQSVPFPISGKITGSQVANLHVEVQNIRTGAVMFTKTTDAGEFLIDWANTKEGVRIGDKFKVLVSGQVQEKTWNGEPNLLFQLNIGSQPAPDPQVCPVCPVPKPDWISYGAALIIALVAGLVGFMGGGVKIYKNKMGESVFQHMHNGVNGYHDASIKHENPKYAHRRWKDNPTGCVEDVKKIQEKGGLI